MPAPAVIFRLEKRRPALKGALHDSRETRFGSPRLFGRRPRVFLRFQQRETRGPKQEPQGKSQNNELSDDVNRPRLLAAIASAQRDASDLTPEWDGLQELVSTRFGESVRALEYAPPKSNDVQPMPADQPDLADNDH